MSRKLSRWHWWLIAVSTAGLILRIAWVTSQHHAVLGIDAFYFFNQARFNWNGVGWFIDPMPYVFGHHLVVQSATHPPLWTLVSTFADVLGLRSYESHLIVSCVLGAGAVFVTGLATREIAGPRAGLIAASIAAVYPNYWINDGTGVAESLLLLLVATVVLVSFRFWRRPGYRTMVGLGALCGLAALTRAEQLLLVITVLGPLALLLKSVPLRRRCAYAGVGALTVVLVVAPWVGFNLARFSQPVFMSDNLGSTLAFSNCPTAYSGPLMGYGDFNCLDAVHTGRGDEPTKDGRYRHVATQYMAGHLSRLPVVMAARVGRELGFYEPLAQLHLENYFNSRPLIPAKVGLFMYYGLVVAAAYGVVVLRRGRITVVPFVGLLGEVVIAAMLTLGATRYRVPLEVGLVVCAAVSVDALMTRMGARRGGRVAHAGSTLGG